MLVGEFDVTKLDFPSDKLTIADLRRAYPVDFEFKWSAKSPDELRFHNNLVPALYFERELAARAYAKAAGLPTPKASKGFSRKELYEGLADDYLALGATFGRHQIDAMLQRLERQAAGQATGIKFL